jgi:inorganic pyrophosphatase
MKTMFAAHPWHGISPGDEAPRVVTCFIELVPTDTVKYEIDKASGHMKLDRPQRFSNLCPMPYGFVPQTLCDTRVAELCMQTSGRQGVTGDQDPLDICVLAERPINHGGILLSARVIGGLQMLDKNEADDKIIAVLKDDAAYGAIDDIAQVPAGLIDRLRHYFLTYKEIPQASVRANAQPTGAHAGPPRCEITCVYDANHAREVISRARRDYESRYP